MLNKRFALIILSYFFIYQGVAQADGSNASAASINLSSEGIGQIVSGSMNLSAAGGQLSVASIKVVGDLVYITLKAANNLATITISVASNVIGQSLIVTGQAIEVSTTAAGHLIYASGKMIAFIPNELGKSLIYSKVMY